MSEILKVSVREHPCVISCVPVWWRGGKAVLENGPAPNAPEPVPRGQQSSGSSGALQPPHHTQMQLVRMLSMVLLWANAAL